eukprot:scaffold161920_cov15-Tisochrysis_lutea.AAC.1
MERRILDILLPSSTCDAVRLIQGKWRRRMLLTMTQLGGTAALHIRCALTGLKLTNILRHLH